MGFFKDIGNAFNGKTRERYDYTINSILSTLQYKGYIDILRGGANFDSEQKLIVFLVISGYFDITTQQYEMKYNGNNNIDDIQDKAHGLTKLFFKDNLQWPSSHIDRVVKETKELAYNNPSHVQNIMALGQAIAHNITSDKQLAQLLGKEVSEEEGYSILDNVFDMMGFKSSEYDINIDINSQGKEEYSIDYLRTKIQLDYPNESEEFKQRKLEYLIDYHKRNS